MYIVYWTTDSGPKSKWFKESNLKAPLEFCEELRAIERAGGNVSFVTMCSQNPNSVGHPGAADVQPGYDWKKRRI